MLAMRKVTLLIAFAMLWLLAFPAWGMPRTHYNLFYLNMGTGMPSNFVDGTFRDSNGFVWISTHGGGLLRYDGYSFVSFGLNGNPMVQLRSNNSHNVAEDHNHRLWVAFDEGVQAIDMNSGLLASPKATDDKLQKTLNQTLSQPCMKVYCDSKGCIWIITVAQITRLAFDSDGNVNSVLTAKHDTRVGELGVADLNEDGTIFIGVNFHMNKVVASGNRLIIDDLSSNYPQVNGAIIGDLIRWKGKTWFATNRGLYDSDPGNTGWHVNATGDGLQHETVTALAVSPDGQHLLIGTLGGVDIMDGNFKIIAHWNNNSPINPLSSNFVNNILVSNGQIWVGTETGGITQLVPSLLLIYNFTHADDKPGTITSGPVNAMYAAPNGDLWVGTVEGGLNYKKAGSYDFVNYTAGSSGLPHNSVSVLTADGDGNLWIGTWGGGVAKMSLSTPGEIVPLNPGPKYAQDLQFIGAMAYDPYNKGIWIGANAGLFFYDIKTGTVREPFPDCRTINGAIGSLVTRDGFLLMGCLPGMVSVDLKKGPDKHGNFSYKHYSYKLDHPSTGALDKITCFCQGRDGTLWVGSNGYGMYHVSGSFDDTLKIHNFITDDGLANNAVKGIVEDGQGMLWIATEHGLSRFNPKDETFSNFSKSDGLLSDQYYFNGAAISRQGIIYLGTDRGLTILNGINPKHVYPGHLRLTSLTVNSQYVLPGNGSLNEDIGIAKEVKLHESDRGIRFEFSSLNFCGKDQGAYLYRMRGYEDGWTPVPPGEHSVHYSMLPAGHYTFEVRYSSPLGNADMQTASIDVVVKPYFWKSWWFLTILAVIVLAVIRYVYKRKVNRLREKEAEELYRPLEAALKESSEPGKLQERIKDILKNQERYRQSQRKTFEEDRKATVENMPEEEPFMDKLMKVMETKYMNSDLNVQILADALGMTRTGLSKRLQTEMGTTTTQFIRNFRLDMAKQMLEDNVADRNVTEIAYRVGFNDPKYFTRCFSQRFGVKPSKYKAGEDAK